MECRSWNSSRRAELRIGIGRRNPRIRDRLVLADADSHLEEGPGVRVLAMPHTHPLSDAMIYTVPLQLLAYQVSMLKGTDVVQLRNLTESVMVVAAAAQDPSGKAIIAACTGCWDARE